MGWYNSKKNVNEYIKMAEGYDGKILIDILKKNLARRFNGFRIGHGTWQGPRTAQEILYGNRF